MPRLYLISFDRTHMAVNNRIGARIAVQYDRFTYKGRPSHSVWRRDSWTWQNDAPGPPGTGGLKPEDLDISRRIDVGRQEVMLRAGTVFWSALYCKWSSPQAMETSQPETVKQPTAGIIDINHELHLESRACDMYTRQSCSW